MHWFLVDEVFARMRMAEPPHTEIRRRQRSRVHHRELAALKEQLQKVDSIPKIHQYLPPETWWELSDSSIATISNKWDAKLQRPRLYVSTILRPGMVPGGEKFTKHLLRRALQRLQERRSAFLWGLVDRLRDVAQW